MNKKKIFGVTILVIFLCALLFTIKNINQSPYDFLKNNKSSSKAESATELLYQAEIGNKKYVVFYVNENGNLASAIIKRGIFTYNIINISSEVLVNVSEPNFHFSSYNKGQNWIYWGAIQDDNIKQVLISETEANFVDTVYSFRIFYLIGTGKVESTLPKYEIIY